MRKGLILKFNDGDPNENNDRSKRRRQGRMKVKMIEIKEGLVGKKINMSKIKKKVIEKSEGR